MYIINRIRESGEILSVSARSYPLSFFEDPYKGYCTVETGLFGGLLDLSALFQQFTGFIHADIRNFPIDRVTVLLQVEPGYVLLVHVECICNQGKTNGWIQGILLEVGRGMVYYGFGQIPEFHPFPRD